MPVIIEPFKIKSVEPIAFTTREERLAYMEEAAFNPFLLHADMVTFDLLTDSGTSAMSDAQWSAMMSADESYAGSKSFWKFEKTVRALTGYEHVIPTHQGRAAERILFQISVKRGQRVVSNNHFDTTRANIEYLGGIADDLVVKESRDPASAFPFKGDIDLARLERYLDEHRGNVVLGMATITNNTGGGQPVSLANLRAVSALYRKHGVRFILDACRFAENAYMIKLREPGQENRAVEDIAKEVFSLADGCTMSGKKDALVNMGGFLAVRDATLARDARNLLILTEGFPTYGGCAARDLEAMAVGLREVLDEHYLEYRLATVRYLAEGLNKVGIPTVQPPGGHAVYIDAKSFLPHVPPRRFPGQTISIALYLEGGIRACEIGSVMFGKPASDGGFAAPDLELVRLAMPRRRYTQSHVDRMLEIAADMAKRRDRLRGFEMIERPPHLPHFTAKFRPDDDWVRAVYGV
jgi:tyrosine phenol-lyase